MKVRYSRIFQLSIDDITKTPRFRKPINVNTGRHSKTYKKTKDGITLISQYEKNIGPVGNNNIPKKPIFIQGKKRKDLIEQLEKELSDDKNSLVEEEKEYIIGPAWREFAYKGPKNENTKEIISKRYPELKWLAPRLYYWILIEIKKGINREGESKTYPELKKLHNNLKIENKYLPKKSIAKILTIELINNVYNDIEITWANLKRNYLTGFGDGKKGSGEKRMKKEMEYGEWHILPNRFLHKRGLLWLITHGKDCQRLVVKMPKKIISRKPLTCEFEIYQDGGFIRKQLTYRNQTGLFEWQDN